MYEVIVFESGYEVGTFDWDIAPTKGATIDGFVILSVTAEPESGEDYSVTVEYA